MTSIILSGIFGLLGPIADGMLAPLYGIILGIVPDISGNFDNINQFLTGASTYVTCIYRWFLFTKDMFSILFLYMFAKYSIQVVSAGISMIFRLKKHILF